MKDKKQKKNRNQIGLDANGAQELAKKLNLLLANFQVHYSNVRGFHWNIKGEKFFELHVKFEEIYTELQTNIDEIAERILTLGQTPMHSFTDYLRNAGIAEATNVTQGDKAVQIVLDSLCTLLILEREILELAGEAGDEGTSAMVSDYIRAQEKLVWMLSSYLNK